MSDADLRRLGRAPDDDLAAAERLEVASSRAGTPVVSRARRTLSGDLATALRSAKIAKLRAYRARVDATAGDLHPIVESLERGPWRTRHHDRLGEWCTSITAQRLHEIEDYRVVARASIAMGVDRGLEYVPSLGPERAFVAQTRPVEVMTADVSTVWVGGHTPRAHETLWYAFETMVWVPERYQHHFPHPIFGTGRRYQTEDEALDGHREIVAMLVNSSWL